jgi:hypothetical protein
MVCSLTSATTVVLTNYHHRSYTTFRHHFDQHVGPNGESSDLFSANVRFGSLSGERFILNEIFYGFSQAFHGNALKIPEIGLRMLPSKSFPILHSLSANHSRSKVRLNGVFKKLAIILIKNENLCFIEGK